MIELLQRLVEAEGGEPVLGDRTGALLEWAGVTAQVARHCLDPLAAAAVRARRPYARDEAVALHRRLADELRPACDVDDWPPLANLEPALAPLDSPPPTRLEGEDLVAVAAAAEALDELRNHLLARRETCPLWGEAAVQASTFSGVSGAIRRALDAGGAILDTASPLLGRLRRALGGQERAVRDEVAAAMSAARRAGWTTGEEPTLRGDRFCLPLRSGDSRRVPGIVHDRSQTGATLFVEPAGVVRLANELAGTRLEIAAEESRILFELNRAVEQAAPALREAAALMRALDGARSHLLWSRQVGGRPAAFADDEAWRVCGGRHPLLMAALGDGAPEAGRGHVVPLDLELAAGTRALVVSGPNAGGKSVALKTVGVLVLLARCGWDVPAREDTRLPRAVRVLADLGDDQSIAASLSSFSAHLQHLARFLESAGPDALVLCDEIGSGTDPQEGTALAFAVLEGMVDRGALVLASTHFGLLKAAVHDHPAMANAAMDYDETDLQPLFTFRVGDPGTSHAFDIAARMGLPPELLARARAGAGEERVQIEKLLTDLDRRARDLAVAEERVRTEGDEAARLRRDLDRRLKGLDKEKRDVLAQVRRRGDDLVREGRRAIERAVREIRSESATAPVVRSARDRLQELAARLPEEEDGPAPGARVAVGDRVRIAHLGLIGRVLEIRGEKLVADADGLRLTLSRDVVAPLEGGAAPPAEPPADRVPVDAGSWSYGTDPPEAAHEIDLRGERAEEAWERLDRLIDRAIPAGLEVLLVIHGHGTGRLRDFLHGKLRADGRVASFREAGPGQGGGGATRITLLAD
ncbi:MAG: hypothetical protein GY838_18220 [bacterium]|nr:hypothetical protein [bacterium]